MSVSENKLHKNHMISMAQCVTLLIEFSKYQNYYPK